MRAATRVLRREATKASSPWIRSETLSAALPELERVFREAAAGRDGHFPLFSPKMEERIWRKTPRKRDSRRREAAVLVPLVDCGGVPSLLFTTRSSSMPTHPSEVSFPGGHSDEQHDAGPEDTALREAKEELRGDYPWDTAVVLGRATPLPSMGGTPVTPVVAVLPQKIAPDTFPGDASEVEETFCVGLADLVAMETSMESERFGASIPVFPAGPHRRIWGLTAVIARPLLHRLFRPVLLGGDRHDHNNNDDNDDEREAGAAAPAGRSKL